MFFFGGGTAARAVTWFDLGPCDIGEGLVVVWLVVALGGLALAVALTFAMTLAIHLGGGGFALSCALAGSSLEP